MHCRFLKGTSDEILAADGDAFRPGDTCPGRWSHRSNAGSFPVRPLSDPDPTDKAGLRSAIN
jgi:hypothetical protein